MRVCAPFDVRHRLVRSRMAALLGLSLLFLPLGQPLAGEPSARLASPEDRLVALIGGQSGSNAWHGISIADVERAFAVRLLPGIGRARARGARREVPAGWSYGVDVKTFQAGREFQFVAFAPLRPGELKRQCTFRVDSFERRLRGLGFSGGFAGGPPVSPNLWHYSRRRISIHVISYDAVETDTPNSKCVETISILPTEQDHV